MLGKQIFALDIGTRSVVGLICEANVDGGLKVIACEREEHRNRAMMDGQIHDVEQVARAVKKVKEGLETKIGQPLKEVAVAAAGRALKTIESDASREINEITEITREDVLALELQAVQSAQAMLLDGEPGEQIYHCVGYSVVHYYLNGERIGSLVGQQGDYMALEVLATFLPRVVVDSMFAVLNRAGLEMTSLTLEPIAASQVVIPPNMRQLNIGLVDVGAGTSDIAISSEGTIVAYAMVPDAGDELTEAICQEYLLDFQEGERVKRLLNQDEVISFTDIVGVNHELSKEAIISVINPKVSLIAQKIGEKIISICHKPPQAVLCIGGGSLTPLLPEKLAEYLGLSNQRVAIRGIEALGGFEDLDSTMNGPEFITPLGIAAVAQHHSGLGFGKVTVNGRLVRIFELNYGTVADALLSAGINIKKLYGRPGMALTLTVNGKLKIIRGEHGSPAQITINGEPAQLDSNIKNNDQIIVEAAVNGRDANGRIADIIEELPPFNVYINGKPVKINGKIKMNGKEAEPDFYLEDRAEIEYSLPRSLGEVLKVAGLENYLLNNFISVNDRDAEDTYLIKDGDRIEIDAKLRVTADEDNNDDIVENSQVLQSEDHIYTPSNHSIYVNNEEIFVDKENLMFLDIFNFINFSTNAPEKGTVLLMEVNGAKAEFTTPIKSGDRLILRWQLAE